MFGQGASTSFGQPTGFGGTGTQFGSTSQPQQSSLFGQTPSTSLFGQPNTTSLFGTPQAQPTSTGFATQPAFGNTSTLFGSAVTAQTQQQQQQNSLFNTNRFSVGGTTSTFGSTAMNMPTGTTIKFQPQTSTDTIVKAGHTQSSNINIRLQCITCMREYESKSLEELRLEDYAAGRKGPQQQQQSGLFGTGTGMTSGTFQTPAATNTAFGGATSTGSSLFSKPFGSTLGTATTTTATGFFNTNLSTTSTGLFGSTATSGSNMFGNTDNKLKTGFFTQPTQTSTGAGFPLGGTTGTTTSSIFGNQSTGQTGSTLFGAPNQGGLSTANKPFGAASTFTTPFGQPAQQTAPGTGMFGAGQTGTTNLFGGQTAQQQPPMFGNTVNSTMNKTSFSFQPVSLGTNTTFNQPSTGTNAFGTSGFGATGTSGSSLFPSTNTLGTGTSFSGFGMNAGTNQPFQSGTAGGSTFNFNSTGLGGTGNTFGTSFGTGMSGGGLFGASQQQQQQQQQQSMLTTAPSVNTDQIITLLQTLPYGMPSRLAVDGPMNTTKTKFTIDPKTLNQYKINAKSNNEIKVQRTPVNSGKPTSMLFDGLDDDSPQNLKTAADIFHPRPNIKKLILSKGSASTVSGFTPSNLSISGQNVTAKTLSSSSFNKENESPQLSEVSNTEPKKVGVPKNSTEANEKLDITTSSLSSAGSPEKSFSVRSPLNFSDGGGDTLPATYVPPKCGIILTRADYYTIPSIEECDQIYNPDDDTCIVDSFTVGRVDYGSIYWKGPLNVKGLNLDELVHIRRKEVIVYPDDELKPPLGEGLNRQAQITLDQVWPIDKTTREPIRDPERLRRMKYAEKLERATLKMDAIFKEYRPETGSWVFVVKHF